MTPSCYRVSTLTTGRVIYTTDIEEMLGGPGAPRGNGLLQVVYWRQGGVEEHPRKYVYGENLTMEEALEVSGKLGRSLDRSYLSR